MTDEESANMGEFDARRIFAAIDSSLDLPGVNKVHWWGGFIAALTGKCSVDVGPAAQSIISATAAHALEGLTIKGKAQ